VFSNIFFIQLKHVSVMRL